MDCFGYHRQIDACNERVREIEQQSAGVRSIKRMVERLQAQERADWERKTRRQVVEAA